MQRGTMAKPAAHFPVPSAAETDASFSFTLFLPQFFPPSETKLPLAVSLSPSQKEIAQQMRKIFCDRRSEHYYWFTALTKSRAEKQLAFSLTADRPPRYGYFLPCLRRKYENRTIAYVPRFPGFLFVAAPSPNDPIAQHDARRHVSSSRHATGQTLTTSQQQRLRAELFLLTTADDADPGFATAEPLAGTLPRGFSVRIASGPSKDLTGVVDSQYGEFTRVRLSLTLLGGHEVCLPFKTEDLVAC